MLCNPRRLVTVNIYLLMAMDFSIMKVQIMEPKIGLHRKLIFANRLRTSKFYFDLNTPSVVAHGNVTLP